METLMDLNLYSIILRMFMSLLFGGVIGIERGLKNRPAGFMTYVMVSCSSTLIMMTNIFLSSLYPGTDPTRLAAQVVSGIGFLGAGTIITTKKNEVRGLTTAAGLWAAAGLGIAIGSGFYVGASIGLLFIMTALVGLRKIDTYVKQHARTMEIYIEYSNNFSIDTLLGYAQKKEYFIFDVEIGKIKALKGDFGTVTFSINLKMKENHWEVLEEIRHIPGVVNIREIF